MQRIKTCFLGESYVNHGDEKGEEAQDVEGEDKKLKFRQNRTRVQVA